VADADLTTAYLEAVNEHLTLPDDERAAAVEELAGHIEESVVAAAEHGVGRDAAVRRALERLGAPQRLASDITDAHRLPGHALAAAGTALRVSIKTGIGAYILAWAGILAVALVFGLVLAGLRKIFGPALLEADFSPATDGLMPAVVAVIVALTLGNALVAPVAVTARRPVGAVRIALVAVGVPIVAFVVVAMEPVVGPAHGVGSGVVCAGRGAVRTPPHPARGLAGGAGDRYRDHRREHGAVERRRRGGVRADVRGRGYAVRPQRPIRRNRVIRRYRASTGGG
jgi:hypothetical protein